MAKAPITKRTVDAAKPAAAEYVVWDDGGKETVKGFGLKVTPAGSKVYLYQYRLARPGQADRTAPRKYTIGKHGSLTPDQARARAKELAAMVEQGIDPRQSELDAVTAKDEAKRKAEERARLEGDLAFENVAARWLEHYELEKGRRPRTVEQARYIIDTHLTPALKGKPLPHITRADLQPIIDAVPIKHRAGRLAVYAYASVLFRWAMERGEISDNPVRLMVKPTAPEARNRVLTDDELVTIWQAAGKLRNPFGAYFRLLMLTGQRREEVAAMAWAELDRASATWIIPANKAKNGVAHIVPLAPVVIEELDRLALSLQIKAEEDQPDAKRWPKTGHVLSIRGVLPLTCYSRARRHLDDEVLKVRQEEGALSPWRVHDLRRTLATGLQRLGTRFEVTEAVLNHVSGAKSGVAGIYQRHDWAEEKRTALEAWARHIAAIVTPAEETNVVPIGSAKQSAGSV
ncbi:site-specific integrase [Novosphingobium sp. SG707]|uniref:tyrosine-type recombinase/integrase n=1 Tax=Novosphingobium sp. SG707 TaxID=2586996 RepID=UPI00144847FC|nr:site-specific integrase [Novosphingobium sp. SG707]NKJ02877.1 integrase [Novosphingobium sp. SG707]